MMGRIHSFKKAQNYKGASPVVCKLEISHSLGKKHKKKQRDGSIIA